MIRDQERKATGVYAPPRGGLSIAQNGRERKNKWWNNV